MIRNLKHMSVFVGLALAIARVASAQTDGTATFRVSTKTASGTYAPRNVMAIWVTDAQTNFVKTLKRQASARIQYLRQWGAKSQSNVVDGITGATLSSHQTHTVTWNCRNIAGAIVPNGTYRVYAEFTEFNGQGPWTSTNVLSFSKGTAGVTSYPPNQANFTNMMITYVPAAGTALSHDLSVSAVNISGPVVAGAVTNIAVAVGNPGGYSETFTVTLRDSTAGQQIGSQQVTGLVAGGATNVVFSWNTTSASAGSHTFVGVAGPVTGETATANNTNTATVTIGTSSSQTDGTATFRVSTKTASGTYAPRNVMAIWVTDAQTNFVKTLKRQAAARIGYLYQWGAKSMSNVVDGVTGATLSQHETHNVTWNCRTTNGAVAPDGTYRFYVEFTEFNGQGPWSATNVISFYKGSAGVTSYPPNQANFTNMMIAYAPAAFGPASLPGTIQAEDYIDYYDTTATNSGGAAYRNDAVDIESCSEGGYDLAWIQPTEWVAYNVMVAADGNYDFRFRVASENATDKSLHMELDGSSIGDAVTFNTGGAGWQTWTNAFCSNVFLSAGSHQLKLVMDTSDFNLNYFAVTPTPLHDLAVTRVTVPSLLTPGALTNVTVAVSNKGNYAEAFNVVLTDSTDGLQIGARAISAFAAGRSTNVVFSWNTAGASPQYHVLLGIAGPVGGEAVTSDNTNSAIVAIASGVTNATLVARNTAWKYNDEGRDLHGTAWKLPSYYDGLWSNGTAQLGYGDGDEATVLRYGPVSSNRYPCYYFRQSFNVDFAPTSLSVRVIRDDGVAIYLNGVEIARDNLPAGPLSYATLASAAISGAGETSWVVYAVSPSLIAAGNNVIAAEVHQSDPGSSDLSFDLELQGITPRFAQSHDVAVTAVSPQGDATAGDTIPVEVTVANLGNVSESFTVTLTDSNAAKTVGSQPVTKLAPQSSTTLGFNWSTLGATLGSHDLRAVASTVSGETNAANNAASAQGTVGTSGFALKALHAAGSVGGFCSAAAVLGNRAYVGEGATLSVLDITTPGSPVRLGRVVLPGNIRGVAVAGTMVYVATGEAGVQIVDASVPATPVHRNTFDTSGFAGGVAVKGNYLYVADGVSGLRIVDVANPAAPVLVGAYATPGPARAVAVAGSTAYVVDWYEGLFILNVANPSSPSLAGSYKNVGFGEGVAVSGSIAYIVDSNGRLSLVNVGNPALPVLSGSLLLTARGRCVTVVGSVAYVPAGPAGLIVVNAAAPSAPAEIAVFDTPGDASCVAVEGTEAYVADGFAGLQVLNVSTPGAPSTLAVYDDSARVSDVVVSNGLAYLAAGESGLQIYDVTNAATPVLLGECQGEGNARSVAVSGPMAYVADGQFGLKIVNAAHPASPAQVGAYADSAMGALRRVAASGTSVAITDGHTIQLVSAANPASPVLSGSYLAGGYVFDLAMDGSRVFAAAGSAGLLILNASGSALSFAGSYNTPGLAYDVSVVGSNAYVADGQGGWCVLNIANPSAPALVSSFASPTPVYGIAASGAQVSVGDGAQVRELKVSNPLVPVPLQTIGPLVRAMRIAASGTQMFVAEEDAGLSIFTSGAVDNDGDLMPDAWEQQIIDANTNDTIRSVTDVLPGGDFDGDGLSNLEEYMAGTSATDEESVFAVSTTAPASGSKYLLRWYSVAGKQYSIYKSTNLMSGFSALATGIDGAPPMNSYTDTVTAVEPIFYMIGVK